jgi:hypothetical protein
MYQTNKVGSNGFYVTEDNKTIKWSDKVIYYSVGAEVPNEYYDIIQAAIDDYNKVLVNLELRLTNEAPKFNGTGMSNRNEIHVLTRKQWQWTNSNPNAIGMCTIFNDDANLIETDVYIKGEEFSSLSSSDKARWLYGTVMHELGHSIGLAHSKGTDSIMYKYVQGYAAYKDTPFSEQDIINIEGVYGKVR